MRTDRVRIQVLSVLAGLVAALWLYPWLESHRYQRLAASPAAEIFVTTAADNGPGSLREALFRALRSDDPTSIVLKAREILVATPLPPLATRGAIEIRSDGEPRTISVAPALTRPVFDVRAGRFELDGVVIRGASSATVLHTSSAERVTLRGVTVAGSDVGVGALGDFDLEVTGSTFDGNRIGVQALGTGTSRIEGTTFRDHTESALWVVGAADRPLSEGGIRSESNRIFGGRFGIVLGNISALVTGNEITEFRGDGIIVIGGAVEITANRIWNGRGAAIRSVGIESGLVERNDVHELGAMGILVQSAAAADVHDNRVYRNGYGIVTVLNDVPATVRLRNNLVLAQLLDGLVVFGDAPLVADNRALRNRGAGIQIFDLVTANAYHTAAPLLTNNVFEGNGTDEPVRSEYVLEGRPR